MKNNNNLVFKSINIKILVFLAVLLFGCKSNRNLTQIVYARKYLNLMKNSEKTIKYERIDLPSGPKFKKFPKSLIRKFPETKKVEIVNQPLLDINETLIRISDFKMLETLLIVHQDLNLIPNEISLLSDSLQSLILYHNEIKYVSPDISKFQNLIKVDLEVNNIGQLNKDSLSLLFQNLSLINNLKFLYLADNNLHFLPNEISNFDKIFALSIYQNSFTDYKQVFTVLCKLESLRTISIDFDIQIFELDKLLESMPDMVTIQFPESSIKEDKDSLLRELTYKYPRIKWNSFGIHY